MWTTDIRECVIVAMSAEAGSGGFAPLSRQRLQLPLCWLPFLIRISFHHLHLSQLIFTNTSGTSVLLPKCVDRLGRPDTTALQSCLLVRPYRHCVSSRFMRVNDL